MGQERPQLQLQCDNDSLTRFTFPGGNHVAVHRFEPEQFFNTMAQHPPALRVQPVDNVVMQTLDALGVDRTGAQRGERPNPQSGPVWVEGALPGDALEVKIERLTPSRRRQRRAEK